MATDKARESGARSVTRIRLVIGERSGYSPEPIRQYFGMMSEGTLCEGAELEFETAPASEFYLDYIEVTE